MEKGSITLEAVYVVSILLLILMWIMKEGIVLYQQTVELAAAGIDIGEVPQQFRRLYWIKEALP